MESEIARMTLSKKGKVEYWYSSSYRHYCPNMWIYLERESEKYTISRELWHLIRGRDWVFRTNLKREGRINILDSACLNPSNDNRGSATKLDYHFTPPAPRLPPVEETDPNITTEHCNVSQGNSFPRMLIEASSESATDAQLYDLRPLRSEEPSSNSRHIVLTSKVVEEVQLQRNQCLVHFEHFNSIQADQSRKAPANMLSRLLRGISPKTILRSKQFQRTLFLKVMPVSTVVDVT